MSHFTIDLEPSVQKELLSYYGKERPIWSGRYRHATKAMHYAVATMVLILAIYVATLRYYKLSFLLIIVVIIVVSVALLGLYSNQFEITSKRIKIKHIRFFTTYVHCIEYYEISNIKLELLFGSKKQGHLIFQTKNSDFPMVRFPRMENAPEKLDIIKDIIEYKREYMEHMDKQGHLRGL
ncbi:MAG: hypothetical protein KU38_08220 [Sulfurovum sp. FS08-3]|nr:MAG: hypothetical protein KU38_08220 [Sulfurovum sp. FS08-3]